MVRCGRGFDPVIIVSPPDAGPDTPNPKFYRYASWQIGNHQPGMFNEIDLDMAMRYFSEQADGMGFENLPADPFPTLDAALTYVTEKRDEWGKKRLEEHGIFSDKDWNQFIRDAEKYK